LDVPVGGIQVRLDGGSDCVFALNAMRVTATRKVAGPKETAFIFAPPASLSVFKGAVKASFVSGPEKLIQACQAFRGDTNEITERGDLDAFGGPDEP
jgi:hypothetical protein